MSEDQLKSPWFPFNADELQVVLGLYGFAATTLAFVGIPADLLAWGSVLYALIAYFAGLLVSAHRASCALRFLPGGGEGGAGYVELFRSARRALFLMHIDDDPPGPELLLLYRRLLDAGVQVRRTVFLRPEAKPSALAWISEFGNHPNLQHRLVLPADGSALPFSFAVVDNRIVILSMPGFEPADNRPYATHLVLRHLLVIDDAAVAAAFLTMHEDTWQAAYPLRDVAELASLLAEPRRLLEHDDAA